LQSSVRPAAGYGQEPADSRQAPAAGPSGATASPGTGAEECSSLADAFVLLAALYRYPDAALWQALAVALPTAAEFTARVLGHALALPAQPALERSYMDLFFSNPFGLPAPPYLSCYLEASGRIEGDAAHRVREMLRAEGLAPDPALKEPEDHLTVALELASRLCRKVAGHDAAHADEGHAALLELSEALWLMLPRFHAAIAGAQAECRGFYLDTTTLALHVTGRCREALVSPPIAL
jgi:TorA maturation chaperone TorD